jgi:hypothetical protein
MCFMLLLLLLCASHRASGQSSVERKKGLIGKLIVASKGSEPGYIIRSLQASGAFAWTAGWLAGWLAGFATGLRPSFSFTLARPLQGIPTILS